MARIPAMAKRLFTERHGQVKPRTSEALDEATKTGLLSLMSSLIEQDWFGLSFPSRCLDGTANAGSDIHSLRTMLAGYSLPWPQNLDASDVTDGQVFDLIEFSYEKVALPKQGGWHDCYRHHHFDYDQAQGRTRLVEEVNRLFERNGIAFELHDGEVTRLAGVGFHETLSAAVFNTGDRDLDVEVLHRRSLRWPAR